MSEKYGVSHDPYTYPGAGVLKNKFGIKEQSVLEKAEIELATLAALRIEFASPPYDFAYFCKLHKQLFGDLFDWAGEIRHIDISKGNTRFCNVGFIETEANKLFSQLADDNYLEGLDFDTFITKLAEYYCDINVLHPFREGNGRAQRLLFEHIIINCGYDICFKGIGVNEWVEANILGYHGDYLLMEDILRRCVSIPEH